MENGQRAALLEHIDQLLREKKINDADIKCIVKQALDEKHLAPFSDSIFLKYKALVASTSISCSNSWSKSLNISFSDLKEACSEIETDLRIILVRRKELIGKDEKTGSPRLARGKIAGVTTFRLARAHIIHLNPDCVRCNDDRIINGQSPCPVMNFNTEFAICCGFEFIKKKYSTLPKEIRAELVYTLTKRHMNQETLGIIFDALQYIVR
ncbi:MAG: hypothetical protein LBB72_00980 [Spirochaetaceae bacterium]|jgi:hypothetical protein|nr:hypothetical protein [Spirochaetaceae bacterium]